MSAVPTPDPVAVGFIGLGQIGAPMAKRLIGWPGGLTVCDALPGATEPFAAAGDGVTVAPDPAAVAEGSTVISVMVRDDAQVREVIGGPEGILATASPGTVIAIHSTVEADTPIAMAALAAHHGVFVVDAPVSGGFMGAHNGTLAIMLGADDDAAAIVEAPFGAFATLVAHLGPVGAGTRAKLARNLITFVSQTAVGEALALAGAAGVDLAKLGEVVRHSDRVTGGAGAVMIRGAAGPLADDDGLRPIFEHTRGLGEKDLDLALALGRSLDIDLPLTSLARANLGAALGVPHD